MTIQKLDDFAENGDKNLTGIDVQQGFVQAQKPARQWFNSLFNSIIKKVNEVITALESISIGTDKLVDGAVTTKKLANGSVTGDKIANGSVTGDKIAKGSVTGDKIAKDADLNTPKLSATYAATTGAAPNFNIAADGTLKRSTYTFGSASTLNVGEAAGNLVVRGADGYPAKNNAIGVGQIWYAYKSSRSANVTYTNTTGRSIVVFVSIKDASNSYPKFKVNEVFFSLGDNTGGNQRLTSTIIVPPGATYGLSDTAGITTELIDEWNELR